MTEIKIYKSIGRALQLIAGSSLFVILGIRSIMEDDIGSEGYNMGWLSVFFFGLGIVAGLHLLFDRRPHIIINEHGIWDRSTKQCPIKWEQITDIYPITVAGQAFISIKVDKSFVFKKKLYKWARKINRLIGAQDINLSILFTSIDRDKLINLMLRLRKEEKCNRNQTIQRADLIKEGGRKLRVIKMLLYVSISIALLWLSLMSHWVFIVAVVVMGIGSLILRFYSGDEEKSVFIQYTKIVTYIGLVHLFLCFGTLKAYEHVSESTGKKLAKQINASYLESNYLFPNNFDIVKQKAELNVIEYYYASRVKYSIVNDDFQLRTTDLHGRKRTFDEYEGRWY